MTQTSSIVFLIKLIKATLITSYFHCAEYRLRSEEMMKFPIKKTPLEHPQNFNERETQN